MAKKYILKVDGMSCSGCERSVQNLLMSVEGVKEVKADHKNKEVEVKGEEELSTDTLVSAIEDSPYEFKGMAD